MSRSQGERAGLSRTGILDAALRIVDEQGLPALTMRRLATALGVEAMTLYHHVPGKDALLDGLVERVCAPLAEAVPRHPPAEWARALHEYACALRTTLLAHPALIGLVAERPASTPALLRAVEQGLGLLRAADFPLGTALHLVNALTSFVLGHTRSEVATAELTGPGSRTRLAELDEAEFPLLVTAARTGEGTADGDRFTLAVEAMLTGFAG
ncbi:TetR/AcrR family transcriptional regulator C-terminal domain-containing protein [Sciscionella sediminilitoris]|uniref:TetR/AcrR family transcriptional regulator C-terminal domain-containing protein n=1 Tax=Sciscionella sediminilitoris TaxID=1445613 RepID=UPI0004DF2BFE|nr:TetR/AcrR family transcriptional regulator C-terminal domain-containing protein [Sciscionella sp. SE31]